MNTKCMKYKRVRRSLITLAVCVCFIMVSLVCCSNRTDWQPNRFSNFNAAYYNKKRGRILDRNGKVLAYSDEKKRTNAKGQTINKSIYFRIYNIDSEFANVVGIIAFVKKREYDSKTGSWIEKPGIIMIGPEGGELAFSEWILTGDDVTSNTGGDIVTTINSSVQKTAYRMLKNYCDKHHKSQNANKNKNDKTDYGSKGAAVVLDIQTGEIIAYADIPSVDYNKMAQTKYVDEFIDYKNDDNKNVLIQKGMFYDYCTALNTPGSTFKPLMTSVFFDVGVCDANTKVYDKGVFEYNVSENGKYSMKIFDYDAKYDAKTGKKIPVNKGLISVKKGLTESYNVVFADLASKADRNACRQILHDKWHFNVGYRAEEDDPSYMDNSRIRTDFGGIPRPSLNVDNNQLYLDTSYGQGEVLVSPIFTTMVTAAIASDSGNLLRPYMVKSYLNNQGEEVSYKKASNGLTQGDILTKGAVSDEAHDLITDAMKNHKVAKGYKKGTLGIKTGTAKLANKSNVSMTGFIEDSTGKPRYAITVCMFEMRGGTVGGGSLAPVFYGIADELSKLPGM